MKISRFAIETITLFAVASRSNRGGRGEGKKERRFSGWFQATVEKLGHTKRPSRENCSNKFTACVCVCVSSEVIATEGRGGVRRKDKKKVTIGNLPRS